MSERKPRTDLPGYFHGLSERLDLQVKLMTPVIVHSGEMGDNDHGWFAELLRQYLPQRIGVDTGFVVNCDSDGGSADFFNTGEKPRTQDPFISPQMDILLLDVHENAPFCVEKTFKVCPVEMVVGAVEVTRDLDASKLRADCAKLGRVKDLARNRKYARSTAPPYWRPITVAVGLTSSLSEDAIDDVVQSIEPHLRPNGILLHGKAFYWLPHSGSNRYTIDQDVLFQFIAVLRAALSDMHAHAADLQAYMPSNRIWESQEPKIIGKPATGRPGV
jgi:hypothetical protein